VPVGLRRKGNILAKKLDKYSFRVSLPTGRRCLRSQISEEKEKFSLAHCGI